MAGLTVNTLILQTILLNSIFKERVFAIHKAAPALCNLEIILYWHILTICHSTKIFFVDARNDENLFKSRSLLESMLIVC